MALTNGHLIAVNGSPIGNKQPMRDSFSESRLGSVISYVESISGSGTTTRVNGTFNNDDLTSGELNIAHSLGTTFPTVIIRDDNMNRIIPDDDEVVDLNNAKIDLSSYVPINGTWFYSVTMD
jgi:hypothetical protein